MRTKSASRLGSFKNPPFLLSPRPAPPRTRRAHALEEKEKEEQEKEVSAVELEGCNHAGFIPTPGPSLRLPVTYEWCGRRLALRSHSRPLAPPGAPFLSFRPPARYGTPTQAAKWIPRLSS